MGFHSSLAFSALFLCALLFATANTKSLIDIHEENWRDLLKGEWMVEFYAPWCPACKDLAKSWMAFADWSKDLDIKVAAVDVTANPGLSGRFLVTALPTIYHVKDGVFRSYSGPRDKDDFISFIEEKKWSVVDPTPSWKYPDSVQMAIVAKFFQLSMSVRDLHNYLIEEKGLPAWASYATFGVATLVLGCILGFLIVCMIDCLFPAAAAPAQQKQQAKTPKKDEKEAKASAKKKGQQKEQEKAKAKKEKESDHEERAAGHASDSQLSGTQSEGDTADEEKSPDAKEDALRQRRKEPAKSKEKATDASPKGAANGKPQHHKEAESPKKKK